MKQPEKRKRKQTPRLKEYLDRPMRRTQSFIRLSDEERALCERVSGSDLALATWVRTVILRFAQDCLRGRQEVEKQIAHLQEKAQSDPQRFGGPLQAALDKREAMIAYGRRGEPYRYWPTMTRYGTEEGSIITGTIVDPMGSLAPLPPETPQKDSRQRKGGTDGKKK